MGMERGMGKKFFLQRGDGKGFFCKDEMRIRPIAIPNTKLIDLFLFFFPLSISTNFTPESFKKNYICMSTENKYNICLQDPLISYHC